MNASLFLVKVMLFGYNGKVRRLRTVTGRQKLKIDVIIPVYKPGRELFELLDRLKKQTEPVQKIILMNTEEKYFEQLVYGTDFTRNYPNVEVHHLSKLEFDHGGTRHRGVQYSDAEVFVTMTQDAMPADRYLIERLTENLLRIRTFPWNWYLTLTEKKSKCVRCRNVSIPRTELLTRTITNTT